MPTKRQKKRMDELNEEVVRLLSLGKAGEAQLKELARKHGLTWERINAGEWI